jgi:hypothetical protein
MIGKGCYFPCISWVQERVALKPEGFAGFAAFAVAVVALVIVASCGFELYGIAVVVAVVAGNLQFINMMALC